MSFITLNGLKLWVQDSGAATDKKGTVLLLHGFPDTSDMWTAKTKALNAAGYRTIAPDLPGLGKSEAPVDLTKYNMQTSVAPAMVALLDALSLQKVTVVGHAFGAGIAWALAFIASDRVERLMVLSVGFPGRYFLDQPFEQRAASWYMLFYLLPDSEALLMANDWQMFKTLFQPNATQEQITGYLERLSQPGALTAGLNIYSTNMQAEAFAQTSSQAVPFKLSMPVMGVHSDNDAYCLSGQMEASQDVVADGCWQYKAVPGGHWWFLQTPDILNTLLLDFLEGSKGPDKQ